jgi:hypothetical protein
MVVLSLYGNVAPTWDAVSRGKKEKINTIALAMAPYLTKWVKSKVDLHHVQWTTSLSSLKMVKFL